MATTRTINRTSYSSNPFIQGLIDNRVWTAGDTISYYLKTTDLNANGQSDLAEKGADRAIVAGYAAWAAVANIRVQQTTNEASAVWIEQAVNNGGSGATHTMPYVRNPSTQDSGGKYNLLDTSAAQFEKGGQWYGIVLHEIGHGLGLNHPHESGLYPGVAVDDANAPGSFGLNAKLYTVMSYNGLTSFTYGTPVTPMAFDIAAVQALYGANMTTATGDDAYVIPTANAVGTWYAAIWDAGGVDTISVGSNAAAGATIDLRAATLREEVGGGGFLSSVAGINGGFTIANGVVIENATGSSFADRITGNDANNRLTGNGGADTMSGLGGNDVLIAGDGVPRALAKPATQVNGDQASAASLDPWFNLTADTTIANASTIPHATARATASGQPEWYKFTVAQAGQITLDIDGASFDTEIYLHNAAGTQLASNDDGRPVDPGSVPDPGNAAESHDSSIVYNVTQPGTYYVRVERYGSDATTATGTYSLHVSVPGATVAAAGLEGSTLDGGDGNDTLTGGNGADLMIGGTGNDRFDGNGGRDTITGGDGNDLYVYDAVADSAAGGASRDRILDFTRGQDALDLAGAGARVFTGDAGFSGTAGEVRVARGDGATLVELDANGDRVADLQIELSGAIDLAASDFVGLGAAPTPGTGSGGVTSGADTLTSTGANDLLAAGAGDDTYVVNAGGVIVREAAGQGNDTVIVTAAAGSYLLEGGSSVETLRAEAGTAAINIAGNAFAQLIVGNAGANILSGSGGADTLDGGLGDDVYRIFTTQDVIVDAGGFDTVYASGTSYFLYSTAEIEYLSASEQAGTDYFYLVGNGASQLIVGNYGDNVLNGRGGDGAALPDTLIGLYGNDTYGVFSQGDVVREAAGQGNDVVYANADYQLRDGTEIELLSAVDQSASGAGSAYTLRGNGFGQLVAGNNAANTIDGRGGNDTLVGLGGNDVFAFTTALDGTTNVDTVRDFRSGSDKVGLASDVFASVTGGGIQAGEFTIGTAAADTDDRLVYDQSTGRLFYDADGNGAGAAVLFAQLGAGTVLAASDFVVVPPTASLAMA